MQCRTRWTAYLAAAVLLLASGGCSRRSGTPAPGPSNVEVVVARGVRYRSFAPNTGIAGGSEAHVLDVDLRESGVRVRVVANGVSTQHGATCGDARRVADWCGREGAVAAINGGYFGLAEGGRKEVIGLLVVAGSILAPGPMYHSRGGPPHLFARSVLAFGADGQPHIGWATAARGPGGAITQYDAAVDPKPVRRMQVESAVACGPRLIRAGRVLISDRDERLASPGKLPRTFVGYTSRSGRPDHLLLCVAGRMTYQDAATFLQAYCRTYHHTDCAEAMCLDGGSSSQLVYREGAGYRDAQPTRVTVPTAVIVMAHQP